MLGLRFLSNVLHTTWLDQRDQLTTLIIEGLLHTQSSVRTSAATCAFKAAQLEHGRRVVWLTPSSAQDQEQEGWEIQLLTAVLESIKREDKTETRKSSLVETADARQMKGVSPQDTFG